MTNEAAEHVSQTELIDGSVISIRRLRPADADAVVRLYESLTNKERYFRFFSMHPGHLQARARSLSEESEDQYAIGAFEAHVLLGVANYATCEPSGDAEIAVVVAHGQHLRGVATALLQQLAEIARGNGLHRLVAEVLADNHLMLQVISDAGWPCTRRLDGSELHIEIDLDAAG